MSDQTNKAVKGTNKTQHQGFPLPNYIDNKLFQAKIDEAIKALAKKETISPKSGCSHIQ